MTVTMICAKVSTMQLLASTNSASADEAILKTLEAVQLGFNKKLLSAYVTGSYANGYAVSTSDVDLFLVFEGTISKEDEKIRDEIYGQLEHITPSLDIAIRGLSNLLETGDEGMREYFLHIFGEPVHLQVPQPRIQDYAYRGMHVGYLRMQHTRKSKPYIWPMNYPEETGPLKGYDWREKIKVDGKSFDSIKEIVVLTGWMATGLIAWKGQTFVPTKNHVVKLFKDVVGGSMADDLELITNLCRSKLSYLVPESEEAYKELQDLLPKVLAFENFFLENYQDFLIENLKNESPIRVRTSIIRLGEIVYPNNRSLMALHEVSPNEPTYAGNLKQSIAQLSSKSI
jgi:predicted nucleotidyltransferase